MNHSPSHECGCSGCTAWRQGSDVAVKQVIYQEATMAEVLAKLDAHRPDHREYEGGWWELACAGCDFAKGRRLSHLDWAPYRVHRAEVFAAALSAAGFGLVADAKREAWDEGRNCGARFPFGKRGLGSDDNPYRAAVRGEG